MKLPLSWIKKFISIDLSPVEIAHRLTMAGLEVDAINQVGTDFTGVVVAEILESEKHPNADKLSVAKVTDGQEEFQIVCGASNCRKGIRVALARMGAKLKDADGSVFEIKKGKLRGVESFGMLCAGEELGLPGSAGIMELPDDFPLGTNLTELVGDTIFDISLTPNLGHCGSILGVARELAAMTQLPIQEQGCSLVEGGSSIDKAIQVYVEDQTDCPRYACRVIEGVKVGPSPAWLVDCLEQCGLRSINNVVDVTNYVLLERGHPLHAFDCDRLAKQTIVVRKAKSGEVIKTLDGKERTLTTNQLVIADANEPVAIAGVMGGADSEVTDQTQRILLEAAYFTPETIRRTSKEHQLQTDASKKFERGTDPNGLISALNKAAELIVELAGGVVLSGIIDIKAKEFQEIIVNCRLERINHVLGLHLGQGEVESLFRRLGFVSSWGAQETFQVTIPTYRNDIKEEIDLIEEVARLYGYENIGRTQAAYRSSEIPSDPVYLFEKKVKDRLMAEGLQEFLTCDLIGPSLMSVVGDQSESNENIVKVKNPTSIEQSVLRLSLLPGLLQVVKHNIDHQIHSIAGFEVGKIHFKEGEEYQEPSVVALILSGKSGAHHWEDKGRDFDFFDMKGIVENLLKELGIHHPVYKNLGLATFHTGRQASIFVDSLEIGTIGEIHPAIQRRLDVNQRILFGEFNIKDLMEVAHSVNHVKPLSVYPGSEWDWTVTISDAVPYTTLLEAIYAQASPILEEVVLLDIYRNEKLGAGFQNVTLRFKYRDPSKTIEQKTVESVHQRLITEVIKRLGDAIKSPAS